ncbi:hypothetical protein HYW75_02455 [Candidatus Pacearchaeota archaeon]|nr:hypothetical protein [Candidatus Pacearchaeota archaeon]
MDNIKKLIDSSIEAEKNWRSADHFIYVLYPAIKDEKLLLRSLENLYKGLVMAITTVLKLEYIHNKIELSKDQKKNLEIFFRKCALKYGMIESDLELLKKVIILGKKHKESGFEFPRNGRVVIMDDEGNTLTLSMDEMKKYLEVVRKLIINVKKQLNDG